MRLADLVRDRPILDPSLVGQGALHAASVCPEARPWLVANLWNAGVRQIVVVTTNHDRALHWQAKLRLCGIPEEAVAVLPSGLGALFQDGPPESVATSDRIGAVDRLAHGQTVVVATAEAALERLMLAEAAGAGAVSLGTGPAPSPNELLQALLRIGYEFADPVRLPGQACARGGLLDVFPAGYELPVRAEWFGDEVESLREFDPMTQRSLGQAAPLRLAPSRETLVPPGAGFTVEMLERSLEREAARLPEEAGKRLSALVGADLACLREGQVFDRIDLYRPWLYPDSGCLLDILGPGGLTVLDDPFDLEAAAGRALEDLAGALEARASRGEMLATPATDFLAGFERLGTGDLVALTPGNDLPAWCARDATHDVGASSAAACRASGTALAQTLGKWLDANLLVGVSTDQPTRAGAMLAQAGFHATPGALEFAEGNLAGGFVCPAAGLALLTDFEVFGVARLRLAQRKFNEGVPVATVFDLKPGDHVVHIHFGVGVYRGLVHRTVDGVETEFLQIDYAPPDRLFVPTGQLDRVHKCVLPDGVTPKINRLVGNDWQKAVKKAREEARNLARELVRLYAERRAASRQGTGPSPPDFVEFEHTFPWAETPSQLAAIEETCRDLEAPFPMDRLVCGDVGFGKTEVAIRAAYKVVRAGRQVAVLCPTTILCEQHFRTFRDRFAGFPHRVEYLNRFRTPAETRRVKEGLANGEVDVVIGTHALLSQKVKFQRLGMVVIDEEQKFGVKQKEALKQLRTEVDVLTLSATPIPRTLSMALMNIRPVSLIADPPPGRLSVRSHVRPFDSGIVREAVLRELARGGQVYYVFNRVEGIYHVAERLRQLVPNARVAVGHGQMSEEELEPVMLGFVAGEVDVLVSTTIVENGLDIPNANTLIVENCDRFGLSQLYQLRGRVGRSDVQAYAYFLYSGTKQLTEAAVSRLQALQEFGSLGSGYSLAFRDLQIRGAGEILGAKQSGQMSAVGFELYSRLIESEVEFLRSFADHERPSGYDDPLAGLEPLPPCDLPVEAYIPPDYIEDEGQRLHFYREATSCRDPVALAKLGEEIEDRYGRMPPPVLRMLDMMRLRLRLAEAGVEKLSGDRSRIEASLREGHGLSPRVFSILAGRHGAEFRQDKVVWRYEGDPVAAAGRALDGLAEAVRLVEEQRAMLSG